MLDFTVLEIIIVLSHILESLLGLLPTFLGKLSVLCHNGKRINWANVHIGNINIPHLNIIFHLIHMFLNINMFSFNSHYLFFPFFSPKYSLHWQIRNKLVHIKFTKDYLFSSNARYTSW